MILLKRNIDVLKLRWVGLVFLLMFFLRCNEENVSDNGAYIDSQEVADEAPSAVFGQANTSDDDYNGEEPQEQEPAIKPLIAQNRELEEGFEDKYTRKKAFDYTESPPKWEPSFNPQMDPNAWFFNLDWQSAVIYPLAIVLVILLLYFLFKNSNLSWEYFMTQKTKVTLETGKDDKFLETSEADLLSLIEKAKKEENWAVAIRFYYNFLLQKLRDKELIQWNKEKTNRDYLLEIKDNELKSQFSRLSYYFDWVYYGQFSIDQKNFLQAEKDFLKTINAL